MKNPFHADEILAQDMAGFDVESHGIREAMPEQHRLFFAALPYLFISTLDENGWPVATLQKPQARVQTSAAWARERRHSGSSGRRWR